MEREALTLDNLAIAMAAKNSKGLVIVQVERIAAAGTLNPRHVKIPGALVDCVVVAAAEHHCADLRAPPTIRPSRARCARRSTASRRCRSTNAR